MSMAVTTRRDVPAEHVRNRIAITGATIGNVMEWYDWGVYAFFAPIFARHFFSSSEPLVPLMLTLATFAVGFLMRPLGGIVLGSYGDRHGRRAQLIATIVLMAAASLLIGILPGYARIGLAAPALLLLARLAQGLSAGGEFGGSSAYLVEFAAPQRRGFVGSWQQFSVGIGTLIASGIATLFTGIMPQGALYAWGWRVPFLLGALIGFYGLYLRLGIDETRPFEECERAHRIVHNPFLDAIVRYPMECLRIVGITLAGTVTYYIWLLYMPTYAAKALGVPLATAQIANTIGLLVFVALIPFMGILSDRLGRKTMLATFALGFVVLTYPLFLLLHARTFGAVLVTELVGIFFLSMFSGSIATIMAEQFPAEVRVSGIAFPYALAVALFGGTAPLLATYLVSRHLYDGIVVYVIIASIISAIVYLTMPETYRKALT
jgi:MHS family alpha-ketoglutarate permease-like MFS transporter